MTPLAELALAGAMAWGSGIRLYATVLLVGVLGHYGYLELPTALHVLQHPLVIGTAAVMTVGEFLADKVPAFDSAWDALHTVVRIPAGALLAWGAFGDATPAVQVAAALGGGLISGGTHLAKAGGRALINTSPEPLSNWTASAGEDGLVLAGLWLAIAHPVAFLIVLALFLLVLAWLLPKLVRLLAGLLRRLRRGVAGARR